MSEITDDFMTQMLSRARDYSIVILKAGPNHSRPGADTLAGVSRDAAVIARTIADRP